MSAQEWPKFSFAETLYPPDGWKTDYAILCSYSADLQVIVTSLLALAGCDLNDRRKGTAVELIKAIEALRGRVCVLAQTGRVAIPKVPRPILKLLDKFLKTIKTDETVSSFHPKAVLVRYQEIDDPVNRQWRIWLGSRNLTKAFNWETGMVLTSRLDGKGQHIAGLAAAGRELAARAALSGFVPADIGAELGKLTWECPPGCEVHRIALLGPGLDKGFPHPPSDTERVFVVSPFLDPRTVRAAAAWGGPKTRRTIVSTSFELQRLLHDDESVFAGFDRLRVQPFPDLPVESAIALDEETAEAETVDDEESSPAGLHAKLLFAAKGARRHLWLGSANTTERGWQGRNVEIVAELSISRDTAIGVEQFVATCEQFNPKSTSPKPDEEEKALEKAVKLLSANWDLGQLVGDEVLEIVASAPPPITDPSIILQVAVLGGPWAFWPLEADSIRLPALRSWQRSDFVQVRVVRVSRMYAWLQIAPCDPRPDEERDHGIIAEYLDPHTFLSWLRSLLADLPPHAGGGDWDADPDKPAAANHGESMLADHDVIPTIEEILRSWARDPSAFVSADQKVKAYLDEVERRTLEAGSAADTDILKTFRKTWECLAAELR